MRFGPLSLFFLLFTAPVWLSNSPWLPVGVAVQEPNQPTPPTSFPPTDKSDPIFQEFVKEVEKNGPILRDPARPDQGRKEPIPQPFQPAPPHPTGPHPGRFPTHQPPEATFPSSPEQQREMRWQAIEQLLRNAREIRSQAENLRATGDPQNGDKLIHLANELRRTAIQTAPTP